MNFCAALAVNLSLTVVANTAQWVQRDLNTPVEPKFLGDIKEDLIDLSPRAIFEKLLTDEEALSFIQSSTTHGLPAY